MLARIATITWLLLLTAAVSRAAVVDLELYRNPSAIATSGAAPRLEVTESATGFDFTFLNDSSADSSLTFVYFESGLSSLINVSSAAISQPVGVYFRDTVLYINPPADTSIFWVGSAASYRTDGDTDPVKIANGINANTDPAQWVTISFDRIGAATLADVLASLSDDGRVVLHLRGLDDGAGGEAVLDYVSIPEPATLVMTLLAAVLLPPRRR